MPDSGNNGLRAGFEPLPSETQTIHFLNPTDPEGNILHISLGPGKKKKDSSPLATIKMQLVHYLIKTFPSISAGAARPIILRIVGATSARRPFSTFAVLFSVT